MSKRTNSQITDDGYEITSCAGIEDVDVLEIPTEKIEKLEQVLFIGTGTSAGIPSVACLAAENPSCLTCLDSVGRINRSESFRATHGGPPNNKNSRNLRTNPSVILKYRHSDGTLHSVLIDCGKTFYINTIRTILRGGVRKLDGVLLTHGHVDALLGLDDLRHWTGQNPAIQPFVDVYCDNVTWEVVKNTFPYLVNPSCATGGGDIGNIKFHLFEFGDQLEIGELKIESLKVEHGSYSDGRPYYANGFRVDQFTYLSDISGFPLETKERLEKYQLTDLLVTDCLFESKSYKSHYSWTQAEQLINTIKPKSTVLVGMAHTIDYYQFQRKIDTIFGIKHSADGIIGKLNHTDGRVYVGFDGLLVKFISKENHFDDKST